MVLTELTRDGEARSLSVIVNKHQCLLGGILTPELEDEWEYQSFTVDDEVYVVLHRPQKSLYFSPLPKINCACKSAGTWLRVDHDNYFLTYKQLVAEFKSLVEGNPPIAPKNNARRTGRPSTRASARRPTPRAELPAKPPRPPTRTSARLSIVSDDSQGSELVMSKIQPTHDEVAGQLLQLIGTRLRRKGSHSRLSISNYSSVSVDRLARLIERLFPEQVLTIVIDETETLYRPPEQIIADERRRWREMSRTPARVVVLVDVARKSVYEYLQSLDDADLIIHRQNYF